MSLITRILPPDNKNTKLTFAEMDSNLYYLQSLGVSGITFSSSTLTLTNPTGGTKTVTINDYYTTGATYSDGIIYFDRNDQLSAYTVNISSLTGDANTFITAVTYSSSANTITLTDNTNNSFNAYIDSVSGLTVNGSLSATTLYGDGSNLIGVSKQDTFVTGGTYSDGTAIFTNNTGGTFNVSGFYTGGTDVFVTGGTYSAGTITFTNTSGGTFDVTGLTTGSTSTADGDYLPLSGGTVTGNTLFTQGISASTISGYTFYGDGSNLTGINVDFKKYGNTIFVDSSYGDDSTGSVNDPTKPFLTYTQASLIASGNTLIILNPGIYSERFLLKDGVDVYANPDVILSGSGSNSSFGNIVDNGSSINSNIYGYLTIINDTSTSQNPIRVTGQYSNIYIEMLDIIRSGNTNSSNCVYIQSDGNFSLNCRDIYAFNNTSGGTIFEIDRINQTSNNFIINCRDVYSASYCMFLRNWSKLTLTARNFYSVSGRCISVRAFNSEANFYIKSMRTASVVCFANDNFNGIGKVYVECDEIVSESTIITNLGTLDNACITDYGQADIYIKSKNINSDGALCYLSTISRPTSKFTIEGNMYSKQNVVARISSNKKTIIKNSTIKRDSDVDENLLIVFGSPTGIPGIFGGQSNGLQSEFYNVKFVKTQPITGTSTTPLIILDGTTSKFYSKNVEAIGTNLYSGSTFFNADTLSEGNIYFNNTTSNVDNGTNITDTSVVSGFIYDPNINTYE